MLQVNEALTTVAFSNEVRRILPHSRPVISLPKGFPGQGSLPRVVPTYSFVDLPKYVVGFVGSHALEEREQGLLVQVIVD